MPHKRSQVSLQLLCLFMILTVTMQSKCQSVQYNGYHDIWYTETDRQIIHKKNSKKKCFFLWKAKCYCWSSSQNGYFCIEVEDNFLSINSSKPRLVCGRFMYHLECSLYSFHNSPYCNPETWVCGHVDFACFDVSVVYLSHF